MHAKRYGIYYAPATNSTLWKLGSQWLGRDCVSNAELVQPDLQGEKALSLSDYTISARRYGFHATIKPPFRLKNGKTLVGLKRQLNEFARAHTPVVIGNMKISAIGRFLALVPVDQSDALTKFASSCVREFDPFRAPMTAERRAKRMAAGLSERQIEMLDRWGYPYVMDQFRMHMTLSDQLPQDAGPIVLKTTRDWFKQELSKPVCLDRVCLYEEAEQGAPFIRVADFALNLDAK